jgi:hypothetical protein
LVSGGSGGTGDVVFPVLLVVVVVFDVIFVTAILKGMEGSFRDSDSDNGDGDCANNRDRLERPPTEDVSSVVVVVSFFVVVVVIRCVCNFNNRGLLIRIDVDDVVGLRAAVVEVVEVVEFV